MQIIVDSNTNDVELYHLSILFQSLAKARGFDVPKPSTSVGELTVEFNVDTTHAVAAIDELAAHAASKGIDVTNIPAATVSVSELGNVQSLPDQTTGTVSDVPPPVVAPAVDAVATDPNLDSAGLPWDARIHAGSRERNTDGSWRVRRRPKGVEEQEWSDTLDRINAELRDLMEIPVTPGAVADAAAETAEAMADCFGGEPSDYSTSELTDAEVDAFVDIVQGIGEIPADSLATNVEHRADGTVIVTPPGDASPIVVPPAAIVPPPVVTPPVAVAAPIAAASPAIETFAQVMTFLTARTPKDEAEKPAMVAKVNEILAANGLTVLTQLGQRPDLIPQVVEQFKVAFGE